MFGLLHNHRLVYQSRYETAGGVTAFVFSVKRHLHARPGQHMVVAATTTLRKPFSLASAPEEEHTIIGTSLRSGSAFKRRLESLSEGQELAARGPVYTYFKPFGIPSSATGTAVLLAQGVGVTPFRSILGHLALTKQRHDTHLIHVAGNGHPFREDTEQWASRTTYVDRATEFKDAVNEAAKGGPTDVFYVAGAPQFTSATITVLRNAGVARDRIRDDPYLFFKPSDTTSRQEIRDLSK